VRDADRLRRHAAAEPDAEPRLDPRHSFETAVRITQASHPQGAVVVYLARADQPADALVGGNLTDGPILLVPACGTVPAVVLAEIRRLDPQRVVALGGPGAVCDAVLAAAGNA
jgi:putative cell wall-binding protein